MRFSILIGALFVFIAYASGCVVQNNDFYADVISRNSRESFTGKVFVSGEKMRMMMQGAVSKNPPG